MADEHVASAGRSALRVPVRAVLAVTVVGANIGGMVIVAVVAAFVLPGGSGVPDDAALRLLNLQVLAGYVLVVLPVGLVLGRQWFWVGRRAGDPEARARTIIANGPRRVVLLLIAAWTGAAVLFGLLNLEHSGRLALSVALTTLFGAFATCGLTYLLVERILRRSAVRALGGVPVRRRRLVSGVLVRAVAFWALGTAIPIVGLMLAGLFALLYRDASSTQLATTMLVVGGIAVGGGLLTTVGAARATADPVVAVRRALLRVREGDLDVEVPVYDNTELGQLQYGVNEMVAGLRERERLRDRFGRQVGRDVAAAAAAGPDEIELGGQASHVAVLFVDMAGSTAMALRRPPADVVELLNRFFHVVVEVVESSGGWINKFEGDAALAVFGAPVPLDEPSAAALSAGRHLSARLAEEVPEARFGIGVSAGDVVAGYVGDVRRYEYTVIGDPVNEAARLTDVAKNAPGGVVAAGHAVDGVDAAEARHWTVTDDVTLRGRDIPTGTAVLAGPGR
jgi:adenylate cyclase